MVRSGNYEELFIGGEWIKPSGETRMQVISPYTEQVIAEVPSAIPQDADRAVAAARHAFDHGPWPQLPPRERIATLQRVADLIRAEQSDLATLVSQEMGCPISLSKTIQAAGPLAILEANLEQAATYPFESIRRSSTGSALVTREPIGVVAAIVPWNVPLSVTMLKLAPALLTGCTLVLKPAPETPLSAYYLAEILQRAGVPDGVVNVLPADRETSEYLVVHPGVDKVSFTGSTAAGRKIAALCGQNLKRVTLELGGKSAAVLLDDADLGTAVESLRFGSFRNSGQVCSLKTRLVVSRRRETELLDHLRDLIESMPVGDPMNPETQIGPMVSTRQRATVERYIEIGQAEGAKAVIGGGRPIDQSHGWFVDPTVFRGVLPDMRIAQEEIFGPVLSVLTFDTEAEAVEIANNSPYGLNGAVFSTDPEHALAVARKIKTGTVELNGSPAGFQAPMGGVKASGIGRENGPEGFDSYVELKSYGLPASLADSLA